MRNRPITRRRAFMTHPPEAEVHAQSGANEFQSIVLICLVEFGTRHGVDIRRDVPRLLCCQGAWMVLGHVVHYESSHLGWIIHACSVVIGIVSPDRRQHRWSSSAIASMTPGALCGVDC